MRNLIEGVPNQIQEAVEIANSAPLQKFLGNIQNVCISGLGGSGIGGTIVSQLTADSCSVPIVVNKDYSIPKFVNSNTLFIVSSYSGNTEETLAALELAQEAGAEIACITSGGKVLEIAKEKGYNHIVIPAGNPPRASFGYSSVQVFKMLTHYGLIDESFVNDLGNVANHLNTNRNEIVEIARSASEKLIGKYPVIYSEASFEGIAVRFRQQINENSKMLCWHHALPEMNHNELVGWAADNPETSVMILRNDHDHYRTQKRMDISIEKITQRASAVTEIWSKGNNVIEKAYYLIFIGDWISLYLAEMKDIDPVEVKVIDELKGRLAEI